jgi:hypothetical protein
MQIPTTTPDQRKTFELFHKIWMGWVSLIVLLLIFIATTVALLVLLLKPSLPDAPKVVIGAIDSLLGVCLHQVFRHLFPTAKASK